MAEQTKTTTSDHKPLLAESLFAAASKLRHTETRDTSKPKVGKDAHGITEADIGHYQRTVQLANAEEWEAHLKDLTFATRYVPVSVIEARAFAEINAAQREKRPANAEQVKLLEAVEHKLQQVIDSEAGWSTRGVFVKTSSRSAKDAAIANIRLKQTYREYLRKRSSSPYPINDRIIAILFAGTQALKCANAHTAMTMLTQSERIEQDMTLALEVNEREGTWNENLVVREWVDIDVSQEYRCFIKDRKVTAISQYNYLPYFSHLIQHRDAIRDEIMDFLVHSVLPRLPVTFQDMVVDVARTDKTVSGRSCWVIELNPFLSSTDGALFSWSHDKDILTGLKPFEFRLTEKASEGVRSQMLIEWREFIENVNIDSDD